MIKRIHIYIHPRQFWVGVYYNSDYKILQIQPLPMVGIRIVFRMVTE